MEIDKDIPGYKAFNKGLINRYGKVFEEGKIYRINNDIKWGNDGNGFHFCTYLEDTLRYFDGLNEEIDICKVMGSGNYVVYDDDYYGYYNMYATEYLKIIKNLTREEIIKETEKMWFERLNRFISGFKLTQEEFESIIASHNKYEANTLMKTYSLHQKSHN